MKTTISVTVFALLAVAGFAIHEPLAARSSVQFLVPHGTPIEGGPDFDRLTFTGPSVGMADVGSCEFGGPFHVQHAVVTPGPNSSGGATRLTGVIQTTGTEIPPGTRLHPLTVVSQCTGADGMLYDKWRGELDENQ